MAIAPGTYTLGPADGTLTVRTGKGGAAAKAGHNLVIEVTAWQATLDLADPASAAVALTADARSLRVRSGSGGISPLGDEEKASIAQSIDEDVLKGGAIAFRSRAVDVVAGRRPQVLPERPGQGGIEGVEDHAPVVPGGRHLGGERPGHGAPSCRYREPR